MRTIVVLTIPLRLKRTELSSAEGLGDLQPENSSLTDRGADSLNTSTHEGSHQSAMTHFVQRLSPT